MAWKPELLDYFERLYQQLESPTGLWTSPVCRRSLQILLDTIRLFGPSNIQVSFNGGKDSTVVLYLFAAALAHHHKKSSVLTKEKPSLVYYQSKSEFGAVRSFVKTISAQFDFDLKYTTVLFSCMIEFRTYDDDWKEEIPRSVREACSGKIPFMVFLIGVRQGDPMSAPVGIYEPNSRYTEACSFLRVHPILNWNYGHVWSFLKSHQLPYCPLYDQGYTSLGRVEDSSPNEALRLPNGTYLPAYALTLWSAERTGRRRPVDASKGRSLGFVIVHENDSALEGSYISPVHLTQNLCNCVPKLRLTQIVQTTLPDFKPDLLNLEDPTSLTFITGTEKTVFTLLQLLGDILDQRLVPLNAIASRYVSAHLKVGDDTFKAFSVPECTDIYWPSTYAFPLCRCQNIFFLPELKSVSEFDWTTLASFSQLIQPSLLHDCHQEKLVEMRAMSIAKIIESVPTNQS